MDIILSNLKKTLLVLLLSLYSLSAIAHEPSEIDISYNAVTGDLSLVIHHKVNSTSVHYIKNVTVFLNRQGLQLDDELIISQKMWGQKIRNEQKLSFIVNDLKPGDQLKISAECSLFGKIERVYRVKESDWRKVGED